MTTDKKARKERPVARGVLDYFPDAIAEVANVSYVGNQQHNPGQEMFWDKSKSNDHADCIARHLMERGKIDDDGMRHSAKAAWRALAMLQVEIENSKVYFSKVNNPNDYTLSEESVTRHAKDHVYLMNFTEVEAVSEGLKKNLFDRDWLMEAARQTRKSHLYDELIRLGASHVVATQIVGGTTVTAYSKQYVYIAGPMRGCPEFNFPAFDKARDEFLQNGWNVISPADIDRADKIDATKYPTGDAKEFDQRAFVYRDFYSLYLLAHLGNGAIAMLDGWESSTGAVAEFFLARWLGLKILDANTGIPLTHNQYSGLALDMSILKFLYAQGKS